jgi:hypothetical protein
MEFSGKSSANLDGKTWIARLRSGEFRRDLQKLFRAKAG